VKIQPQWVVTARNQQHTYRHYSTQTEFASPQLRNATATAYNVAMPFCEVNLKIA